MASSLQPKILAFKQYSTTAIARGVAVKFGGVDAGDGSVESEVTPAAASTDQSIGICQNTNATVNAGDKVEVALPGGGAKALAHTTIAAGDLLVPYTDGSLQPTTGSGDRIIAVAMQSAVVGDIFEVMVVMGMATGATN